MPYPAPDPHGIGPTRSVPTPHSRGRECPRRPRRQGRATFCGCTGLRRLGSLPAPLQGPRAQEAGLRTPPRWLAAEPPPVRWPDRPAGPDPQGQLQLSGCGLTTYHPAPPTCATEAQVNSLTSSGVGPNRRCDGTWVVGIRYRFVRFRGYGSRCGRWRVFFGGASVLDSRGYLYIGAEYVDGGQQRRSTGEGAVG